MSNDWQPTPELQARLEADWGMTFEETPGNASEDTLTIYSVDSCQGCRMTAQMLEKAGVPFQVVDLSERPDLVEQFRAEGLIQAPVLEHQGERTAGFRPDRIRSIVSSMNGPNATAIHAASQSNTQRPTPHTMPAYQRTPNTPTR